MKKKIFMVKSFARNVKVENHDLRRDYGLDPCADREMTTLENKVSPQLYGMLVQQLLGFHADMQYEMAVDLVIFACQHIANSTGCPSVDFILDVCYTWIATDQGILKPGVKSFLYNNKL
jgi:hypothetical protein